MFIYMYVLFGEVHVQSNTIMVTTVPLYYLLLQDKDQFNLIFSTINDHITILHTSRALIS